MVNKLETTIAYIIYKSDNCRLVFIVLHFY